MEERLLKAEGATAGGGVGGFSMRDSAGKGHGVGGGEEDMEGKKLGQLTEIVQRWYCASMYI
jgi:hypothetical protein